MPLRAAASLVDITPQLGIALGGQGPTTQHAMGAFGRLTCTAILLDFGPQGGRLLLLALDLHAAFRPLLDGLGARLSPLGIDGTRIVAGATHTHRGPGHLYGNDLYDRITAPLYLDDDGAFDEAQRRWLIDRIGAAVEAAADRLQDAELGWATHAGPDILWNRSSEGWLGAQEPDFDPGDPTRAAEWLRALDLPEDGAFEAARTEVEEEAERADDGEELAMSAPFAGSDVPPTPTGAVGHLRGEDIDDAAADPARAAALAAGISEVPGWDTSMLQGLRWMIGADNVVQALLRGLKIRARLGFEPIQALKDQPMLGRSPRAVDRSLHAIAVRAAGGGGLIGAIVSGNATPTVVGPGHAVLCGDVPGFAAWMIRRELGDPTLPIGFVGGTLGDANYLPEGRRPSTPAHVRSLRAEAADLQAALRMLRETAWPLAMAGQAAIGRALHRASSALSLEVWYRNEAPAGGTVELPGDRTYALPDAPRFGPTILAASDLSKSPLRLIFHENCVDAHAQRFGPHWPMTPLPPIPEFPRQMPLRVVRLTRTDGLDLHLVGVPVEVSTRLGHRLRRAIRGGDPRRKVMVLSLCGDFQGYMGTPREYYTQCYEAGHTPWGAFGGRWLGQRLQALTAGDLPSEAWTPAPLPAASAVPPHLLIRPGEGTPQRPTAADTHRLEGWRTGRRVGAETAGLRFPDLARLRTARRRLHAVASGVAAVFDGPAPDPFGPRLAERATYTLWRRTPSGWTQLLDPDGHPWSDATQPTLLWWWPKASAGDAVTARWLVWIDPHQLHQLGDPALDDLALRPEPWLWPSGASDVRVTAEGLVKT